MKNSLTYILFISLFINFIYLNAQSHGGTEKVEIGKEYIFNHQITCLSVTNEKGKKVKYSTVIGKKYKIIEYIGNKDYLNDLYKVEVEDGKILVIDNYCINGSVDIELKELYEKRVAFIDSIRNNSNFPVLIHKVSIIGPSSVSGYKIYIDFEVLTQKTIKYLNAQVEFFNRVGDKISDTVRHNDEFSLTHTGPYNYGFRSNETVPFTVYLNALGCVYLTEIKIDYMDGTSDLMQTSDINKILAPYEYYYVYLTDMVLYKQYGRYTVERCCNVNRK